MADAVIFVAWCAGWCIGLWAAWRLGFRDARKGAPRRCRGVKLWNRNA